jgi:hypothetical protein
MKIFKNCCCHIRAIAVLPLKTVVLSGKHSKIWFITEYTDSTITRIPFNSSSEAKNEFKKYKKYEVAIPY